MTTTPLVSCIIIFFNAQAFIQEAIESILVQTYGFWEILLVDDGSTDGSTQIAKQYAATKPQRILYLNHPNHQNQGMSASRNLGIAQSKGEYIAFLDSDDRWIATKLAEQVSIMMANPEAAMVYGKSRYWYSWRGDGMKADYFSKLGAQSDTLVYPPHLLTQFLRSNGGPSLGSTLVRRSIFSTIGKFEIAFRGMCEDQVFFAKIFLNAPIFIASQYWHDYRQHPNSCTVQSLRQPAEDFSSWGKYLLWLETYMKTMNVEDSEAWTIVQSELESYRHPKRYRLSILLQQWKSQTKQQLEHLRIYCNLTRRSKP